MKKTLRFAAFSAGAMLAGAGVASAQEAPPPADQPPPVPAPAPTPVAAAAPVPAPHTVAAGESLSKIAQADLGTSDRWLEIFVVNRAAIADPNVIEVGQVLAIPAAPVVVPADLLASLAPATVPSRLPATSARPGATLSHASPSSRSGGSGSGSGLAGIRACESGGNYGAVSSNGAYRGAYQFNAQAWQSVGGSGDPAAAAPAEQDARAAQLQSQLGSSPWPNCG